MLNFYEQKDFSGFWIGCVFAEMARFSSAVGKVVHRFLRSCRWRKGIFIHKSDPRPLERLEAQDYPPAMPVAPVCMQESLFLLKSGSKGGGGRNLSTAWITSKLTF